MKPNESRGSDYGGQFRTTLWSVVLLSAQSQVSGSRKALADLCQLYWYPLYAFVRRRGYSAEDAQDLTQGFFLSLLERKSLRQTAIMDALRPFLDPINCKRLPSYEEVAVKLQVSLAGVKTLIHRVRKRYNELLREEVARTVTDPQAVDDEIHALCEALIASQDRLGP